MTTALRIAHGSFGRVALLDMDKPLVPHAHSQCHVIFKASGADSTFCVRDRPQPVTERTAILVNAWEPHFYRHDAGAPRTVYLALYIEPRWLASIHEPLGLSGRPGFFPLPCVRISPRIRGLADDLIAELLAATLMPQARLESLLFELMLAVIEPFSQLRYPGDAFRAGILLRPDGRIRRAVDYLKDNLLQPLDVDRLAREACLSRAQFFVRFRRSTGLTPAVFFNTIRMEAVCRRLAQPHERATLGHLSRELGFSDQGNFTRFVRDHAGVVPSEYRRVVEIYTGSADTPH